jgi:hypothetical protein
LAWRIRSIASEPSTKTRFWTTNLSACKGR